MKKINKKLLIVLICLAVFFIILFKYYDVSNTLSFDIRSVDDPFYEDNILNSYKKLIENSNIIYFRFGQYSGYKRHYLEIIVKTMESKKNLNIEKFVFQIEEESVVCYKKSIKLEEKLKIFEYSDKQYSTYSTRTGLHGQYRINISRIKLFKDRKIEGKEFNVKMIVYYSFDDEEIQSSEYLYKVVCYDRGEEIHPWVQYLIYNIMGVDTC